MSTIVFTVDGTDYSGYVFEADIWRDAMNGVGRWEVKLDPRGASWIGLFDSEDPVVISIDGSVMLRGYLDDPEGYITETGYWNEMWRLRGRDYGFDLAELFLRTAKYRQDNADDIVDLALAASGTEILYTSPTAAPVIDYEFTRTYLADGIREIAEIVNYDFYVDDTPAPGGPNLHFFAVGAVAEHTAVDLTAVAGATTNNILRIDPFSNEFGSRRKNWIEAHAGNIDDHWTDLNTGDWVAGVNCVVTPELTLFLNGINAIRCTKTAAPNDCEMWLTFPQYSHTTLDMSDEGFLRYLVWCHDLDFGLIGNNVSVTLREATNGNIIQYYRTTGGPVAPNAQGYTAPLANDRWYEIRCHTGTDVQIGVGLGAAEYWYWVFRVGLTDFDWANVDMIMFDSSQPSPDTSYFILDGLRISTVEALSVASVAPAPPRWRMEEIYRPDIKSQAELDVFSASELAKKRYPLEAFQCITSGQTDSVYAAQSLDVRIPAYGINVLTPYRIYSLHHHLARKTEREIPAYDFTTEYYLIAHTIASGTQYISPLRVARQIDPVEGYVRQVRREQHYREPRTINLLP